MSQTESNILTRATSALQKRCRIVDDAYWDLGDVLRKHPEIFSVRFNDFSTLAFSVEDGFRVHIVKVESFGCYFNGYVSIPSNLPFVHDALASSCDEWEFQYRTGVGMGTVELTYISGSTIGWDHAHGFDANLLYPAHLQPEKKISGPVQVLEEALSIIQDLKKAEETARRQKKKEEMAILTEDLMRAAWHPARVLRWIEHGVEL